MRYSIRHGARQVLQRTERLVSAAFGEDLNPLYHLGALSIFFFWIVLVSGIYLFIFFETSVFGAFQSVEALTHEQWYVGGVMRSLHRYASDAAVVTMTLHLVREFVHDRYRGFRWFSWLTGVPLIWLVFILGITGYWLVWDKLAQYVAIASSELLDVLPIFTEPMARNFLTADSVSDRFFTLMAFLHLLGLPVFLLFFVWFHVLRIARPDVNPPRGLALGTFGALLVLSLVHPAVSHDAADLATVPATLYLDWFYLNIYPILDFWSPLGVWALLGGVTAVLAAAPWLPWQRREPVAVVDLGNCNGCGRCFADCPYGAVIMQPRSDGLPFTHEAAVSPDLCASCGICVGACPTATPFRRAGALIPGIDLPQLTVGDIRARAVAATEALTGPDRVLVYGCRHGPDLARIAVPGVAVQVLPCIGALPPSFIDFVLSRDLVDGVFLTGCREGDCSYRLGIPWTEQRLRGERDPALRARVPRDRIGAYWAGATGGRDLVREITAFRARLRTLAPYTPGAPAAAAPVPRPLPEVFDAADRMG